jgi:uncharacterized membrane protein YozB (DUF420 family)
MSILGTRAELIHDLNLILQILIFLILLTGAYYAKRKIQYQIHGKIMALAVALNALSIMIVMGPRLIESLSFLTSTVSQSRSQMTFLHPVLGGIAELLGIVAVLTLRPCGSKMGSRVRLVMRITFMFWAVAFLVGLAVYLAFYVM